MPIIEVLGRPIDGDSPYQSIESDDTVINPSAVNGAVKEITEDYTVEDSDDVILVDETGGAVTVTLPEPSWEGESYTVKQITGGANNTTIETADSSTIDGASSQSLAAQWEWYTVKSDGTDYYIVASG